MSICTKSPLFIFLVLLYYLFEHLPAPNNLLLLLLAASLSEITIVLLSGSLVKDTSGLGSCRGSKGDSLGRGYRSLCSYYSYQVSTFLFESAAANFFCTNRILTKTTRSLLLLDQIYLPLLILEHDSYKLLSSIMYIYMWLSLALRIIRRDT